MISWLLNRIEKAPSTLFRRAELIKRSRTGLNNLKKAGILLYVQPNDRGMSYPCSVFDCGNGCSMDVFKKKCQYYAVCPYDRIDPKPLTDDDIARYRFNLEPLIEKIRKANGLDGSNYSLTPRLYFIGERVVAGVNTAFVFALFPDVATAEPHLLSLLGRVPSHCPQIVVVAPSLSLAAESIYSQLVSDSIFPITLSGAFGKQNFRLNYLATMRKKIPTGPAPKVSPLTKKQIADKEKYEYRCQDRLHIPGAVPLERRNEVLINGHKVILGDKLFSLLLRLILELKKCKGGWVESGDLMAGGFINDVENRQPFSHLRHAFKPWLIEGDGKNLIEASRSKQYRLSTHPEFVTCDRKKLRDHPEDDIKKLMAAIK